jgi:hypothetical protein
MPGSDNTNTDAPKEDSRAAVEQARAAMHVPMTEEQIRGV